MSYGHPAPTGYTHPSPRHRVRSPENVEFEYTLASPVSRLCAWALDNLVVGGIVLVGLVVIAAAQGTALRDVRVGFAGGLFGFVGLLVVFAAQWGYFVVCEWWMGGQTPGKRVFRVRV